MLVPHKFSTWLVLISALLILAKVGLEMTKLFSIALNVLEFWLITLWYLYSKTLWSHSALQFWSIFNNGEKYSCKKMRNKTHTKRILVGPQFCVTKTSIYPYAASKTTRKVIITITLVCL